MTSMFDFNSYLIAKNQQINERIDALLKPDASRIVSAMRYSLTAGGKRARPVLCIGAAEAVGANAENVLTVACAIEMIHTYSLIHDDLPAMDDDDLRRGKPTCHVAYDEATAILAGDALLTLAFQVLAGAGSEYPYSRLLEVILMLSHAAGYKGMVEGQMRDIASEGISLNLDEIEQIHALKTGALIQASVLSGAILGGGNAEQIEHLRAYGKNIGLAFQVTDDILNVEGDPALLGKAVGSDESRKKSTYPSIMGIEESKEFARKLVNDALAALNVFDSKAEPLRAVARYIIERKR